MKRRRGYFKHYNDASDGKSLRALAARKDYLAIALWWQCLEVCNQNGEGKGSLDLTVQRLHYNCTTKVIMRSYRALIEVTSSFDCVLNGKRIDFQIANYSEYQDLRSEVRHVNRQSTVPIKDKRLKIKDTIAQKPKTFEREIEEIYLKKYPRKIGKSKGLQKLSKQVKTKSDLSELETAVTHYAEYCRRQETETQFIKHFSTFATEWRDWINVESEEKQVEEICHIQEDGSLHPSVGQK